MKKINVFFCFVIFLGALIACGTSNTNETTDANMDDEVQTKKNSKDNDSSEEKERNDTKEEQDSETEEISVETTGTTNSLPEMENEKEVTMMIEGMEEKIMVHLFEHPNELFSTYIPSDMISEYEDQTLNVYANFNDTKNENARFFIMNNSKEDVNEHLQEIGFSLNEVTDNTHEFSDEEMKLEKNGFLGRVVYFDHKEEPFSLGYYYPEEFADGFSARTVIIIDELKWH
ncbi:hypothetical protein [Saliterribacillus persicus]|uniref:Uncharacterized protein n=1 Tax=Saliterribacillus persicus TaxID=930114 RepID=A0A368X6V7_9BACI|nr:hypothetical protein [Saliterribacillus persicus]RCW63732.1 hypothetical protein DFR57_1169 [Saliterribacillus persicus]